MFRITLQIDGMMCGMCEVHINDEVRKSFVVKKVSSSYTKGETIIIAENDLPDTNLKTAIEQTGYHVNSVSHEPYEKKGLLDRLRKKNEVRGFGFRFWHVIGCSLCMPDVIFINL